MNPLWTLCDPSDLSLGQNPQILDFTPNLTALNYYGWMWWKGEQREIREIHVTKSGIQIELLKRF